MEYIRMAIVTDDRAYGEAAARSLLIGNRNFDLTLLCCSEFCRRMREGGETYREGFDLILWDSEGVGKVYGGNIVWLTERASQVQTPQGQAPAAYGLCPEDQDPGKRRPEDQEPGKRSPQKRGREPLRFAIDKYSSSQEMTAAVFEIYEKLTGRKPAGRRPDRMDVFAFASWQGGSGCSTLAMAAAQEFVRFYRKRVLYLSFEGMESTPLFMTVPPGMKTLGEYLYHLDPQTQGGNLFLEEYLIRDSYGVEAFAPSGGCNPMSMAGGRQVDLLLPALMDSGRFDVIVLDAGSGTGESVREALGYADRICLVSAREEPAREARFRLFLKYGLGREESGEDRIIRVFNRCGRSPTDKAISISAREHPGSELILEGSFGRDIHKLTELCYNGIAEASRAS